MAFMGKQMNISLFHFCLLIINTTSDQQRGKTLLKIPITPAPQSTLDISSPLGRQQPHK